jgi:cyanate permease
LAFPSTTQANVGRSATARAIMFAFAVSGFTAYTVFGVLPAILIDYVGVTAERAAKGTPVFRRRF